MEVSIGEILRNYVAKMESQKSVAMEWVSRAGERGGAPDAAEARLSEALAGKLKGVDFFFREDWRSQNLFDVLGVPPDERHVAIEAAKAVMGPKSRPLVIDLRDFEAHAEEATLGEALTALLDATPERVPVKLVVGPKVRAALKRRHTAAAEVIQGRADHDVTALVGAGWLLSSRRLVDYSRWGAIRHEPGWPMFDIEPPNAVEMIAKQQLLPTPEPAARPLATLGFKTLQAADIDSIHALDRRRLAMALPRGAPREWAYSIPECRLALAKALDVEAGATEQEYLDHELTTLATAIGLEITKVQQEELEQRLIRAALDPKPALYRAEDHLHAINPPGEPAHHARLTVHRFPIRDPAPRRILDAIAAWTDDDFAEDPLLTRVVDKVAQDENDRVHVDHARAWLLAQPGWPSRPAQSTSPDLDVLARLVDGELPMVKEAVIAAPQVARATRDRWGRPVPAPVWPPSSEQWLGAFTADVEKGRLVTNAVVGPFRVHTKPTTATVELTRAAAQCWKTLRRAVADGFVLAGETAIAEVGELLVEVRSRSASSITTPSVSFEMVEMEGELPGLRQIRTATIPVLGGELHVPAFLRIAGHGVVFEVTFTAASLFVKQQAATPANAKPAMRRVVSYDD